MQKYRGSVVSGTRSGHTIDDAASSSPSPIAGATVWLIQNDEPDLEACRKAAPEPRHLQYQDDHGPHIPRVYVHWARTDSNGAFDYFAFVTAGGTEHRALCVEAEDHETYVTPAWSYEQQRAITWRRRKDGRENGKFVNFVLAPAPSSLAERRSKVRAGHSARPVHRGRAEPTGM